MKKLSTIALFIFGVIVTAILTAGLVFYQNSEGGSVLNEGQGNVVQGEINKITASGKSITLDMSEITKHNKASDCWMLISGKVYNITSFFGSHPGGNSVMAATCGTDATAAYMTQDPNAKSSSGKNSHSSGATGMLASYFLGNLNQTIGTQAVTATAKVIPPPTTRGGDDEEDD